MTRRRGLSRVLDTISDAMRQGFDPVKVRTPGVYHGRHSLRQRSLAATSHPALLGRRAPQQSSEQLIP